MSGMGKTVFGAGMFALGAVAGFFASKKFFGKRYREDVADIQAFYNEKLKELGVMDEDFEFPEDEDSEDEDDDEDEEHKMSDEESALASYRGDKRRVVDYTKYSKPPLDVMKERLNGVSAVVQADGAEKLGAVEKDDEDEYTPQDDPEYEAEIEQAAEEYARRRSENMRRGEPYLIEPDEYREGPEDYERQTLYYYTDDRTLCEDGDEKVDDEEACVGFDYEDKLDMQTTCWVRNDKMRMLYEIHRINGSYEKSVLGVRETPREREFRIQGRRKQALDDMAPKQRNSKEKRR